MVDIGTKIDLAKWLNGGNATNTSSQSTTQVTGTVMADSNNGTVSVMIGEPDGSTTAADLTATIPIIGSASAGDEVVVIVQDATPVAIAAPGWGDDINDKTQYITFVSSGADAGLHIHENASNYNVDGDLHLDSGGVEIRDNGDVLASFGASTIELGKNHTDNDPVTINLMNGNGSISIEDVSGDKHMCISSARMRLQGSAVGVLSMGSPTINVPSFQVYTGVFGSSSFRVRGYYTDDGNLPAHAQSIQMETGEMLVTLSDALTINNDPGTSGYVLTSQGAGQPPVWAAGGGGGGSMATTATLSSGSWVGGSQTVSATGVTSSNNVIVAPAPSDAAAWAAAGIVCTAQGSGTLTFTCSTTPSANLTANVLIV